ncbi:FAD-binding protein [Dolosicoccus paucivorans]|uniref:FAD-binding protein n=1 Tax=Dolosicoccus paucivorans TaxID=84521 RepID=UPI00356B6A8C
MKEEKSKSQRAYSLKNVVVVGSGGAGFTAALSAKEAGAESVVILEKLPVVGGNTLISGAEYAAPGNEIQAKEGIEDSPELFC